MTRIYHVKMGAAMAALASFALGGAANAASDEGGRAGALQALIDCRATAGDSARLACYDAAAAGLEAAEASGEVIVLDRAQADQARREAFGFAIPTFDLFNRGERPEKMDRASFTVVSASQAGFDGPWIIEVDSGAVWRQIDQERVSRRPKPGMGVEIRSAAMGSYFMNIDGQRAIRVTRER